MQRRAFHSKLTVNRRKARSKAWLTYEEVARYLLNDLSERFGLSRVEGKQIVQGRGSGTSWEIDAKGIRGDGTGFVVVEVRRYTTRRLDQEKMAAIAYRVRDTRAKGGIVVTPLGLQEGAKKIARKAGVVSVRLCANSTTERYLLHAFGVVMFGGVSETIQAGSVWPIEGTLEGAF
jgi:hypothetical protein